MQANDYQRATLKTAIYPTSHRGSTEAITYCALGLASEAGEVAGKVKKIMRGDKTTVEALPGLKKELGDVAWYLARICDELGWSLEEIFQDNIAHLAQRAAAGTLPGEGDNR